MARVVVVLLLCSACLGTPRLDGQPAPSADAGRPPTDAGVPDANEAPDSGPPACEPVIGPAMDGEGPRSPSLALEAAAAAKERARARHQQRFLEALLPGSTLASLRIEQRDIRCGHVTPRRAIDIGRDLFALNFTTRDGLGNGLAGLDPNAGSRAAPNFRRFQRGEFGGPETTTCASCHWKGGEHGAGDRADNSYLLGDGDTLTTHEERNPPSLLGLGWAQIVAEEMNAELAAIREASILSAMQDNAFKEVPLVAKGISFGTLLVHPDGTVDTSGVEGVDTDLIIKPFGWKGVWPTIRRFAEGSLQFHMGIQAEGLVERHKRDGLAEHLGHGPDPDDPDHDGVRRELTDGQLTALEMFLATLEVGVREIPPQSEYMQAWLAGEALFESVGCTSCHTPYLEVDSSIYRVSPDVGGERALEIDLATLSAEPRPTRAPLTGKYRVYAYSDFRRHDMGEEMQGPNVERGVPRATYLTRRLWGLSRSSPYLYDGRAGNLDQAILAHGGEATSAREAFKALSPAEQGQLRMFLLGLTRERDVIVR